MRQLLSHQAGLVAVDCGFSLGELLGHAQLAQRLAAQWPLWYPGAAHGYHALTIGTLADELVRRVTGQPLPAIYEAEIRQPTGADFFVGVPETEVGRVRPVLLLPPPTAEQMAVREQMTKALGHNSLAGPVMSLGRSDFPQGPGGLANNPDVWRAGPPAAGGVGTAAGMATLFARTISDAGGPRLLSPQTVAAVSQLQSRGPDMVLGAERAYGIVFMKPSPGMAFGSYRTFGHDGADGSLAFADPEYGLAFGYVPARMTFPGGADQRALTLAAAIRDCLMA